MGNKRLLSGFGITLVLLLLKPAASRAQPCEDWRDTREICEEHDIYLMPALTGHMFSPAGGGTFFGAGAQVSPYIWNHNNDNFGPGQGALFLQASLLRSASSPASMALFEGGMSLSIERNASRRWLIPFFGFTLGYATHAELPNTGFVHGLAGLHVYWHPNATIDLSGGYQLPFTSLDEMRGPRALASMRFSLW